MSNSKHSALKQRESVRPLRAAVPAEGACVAPILGFDEAGSLLVKFGALQEPVVARVALSLDAEQARRAVEEKRLGVFVFESGDAGRPILIAWLHDAPEAVEADVPEEPSEVAAPIGIEADCDGRRVQLTAQDEIVLRCGEASITLRRNGKIIVRGAYVETYATGTNRIKGGQVRIN